MLETVIGEKVALTSIATTVFLIIVFAKYGDIMKKAEKAFGFIAGGGLFFLVAATFKYLEVWPNILSQNYTLYGQYLFELLGWLFVIIGACWAAYEMIIAKK